MQARLEMKRFPLTLVAVLFALAVTLLLGGTLGYALKPATVVSGPAHVIVVPASQDGAANASDNRCYFINHQKVC
jgi:hypothetical protein